MFLHIYKNEERRRWPFIRLYVATETIIGNTKTAMKWRSWSWAASKRIKCARSAHADSSIYIYIYTYIFVI